MEVIKAKRKGKEIARRREVEEEEPADLMAALKASVDLRPRAERSVRAKRAPRAGGSRRGAGARRPRSGKWARPYESRRPAHRAGFDYAGVDAAEAELAVGLLFTNSSASASPKRALNLAQPVCGSAVTSITAVPIASRVPAGRFAC